MFIHSAARKFAVDIYVQNLTHKFLEDRSFIKEIKVE